MGGTAWESIITADDCAYHGESIERYNFHRQRHECLIFLTCSDLHTALRVHCFKCYLSFSFAVFLPPPHPAALRSTKVRRISVHMMLSTVQILFGLTRLGRRLPGTSLTTVFPIIPYPLRENLPGRIKESIFPDRSHRQRNQPLSPSQNSQPQI